MVIVAPKENDCITGLAFRNEKNITVSFFSGKILDAELDSEV